MGSVGEQNELKKLREENQQLKADFRALVIEKNRTEDKLYRAINRALNEKKRKIAELERELEGLKGVNGGDDKSVSSTTCEECKKRRTAGDEGGSESRVKGKRRLFAVVTSEAEDPGSDYGSETDIDDGPLHESPRKTVVIAHHEPSASTKDSAAGGDANDDASPSNSQSIMEANDETKTQEPSNSVPLVTDQPKSPAENKSSKKNDDDSSQGTDFEDNMEQLMDEFCS